MCFKVAVFLLCASACVFSSDPNKQKRQIKHASQTEVDPETSETGFPEAAAVQGGSKYFQDIYVAQHKPKEIEFGHVCETPDDWEQRFEKINFEENIRQGKVSIHYFIIIRGYIHVPAKDHYEHGHRRGNEHHFIEKHEKAKPHEGEFKTKVRWGDKHGGYGEHYWDYNHAGHDGHDGEESSQNAQYATYDEEETAPVPAYTDNTRGKRERQFNDDAEFISPQARSLVLSGVTGKHGGNYKSEQDFERGKREQKKKRVKYLNGDYLLYRPDTGRVVDQKTGITYELKPVEF